MKRWQESIQALGSVLCCEGCLLHLCGSLIAMECFKGAIVSIQQKKNICIISLSKISLEMSAEVLFSQSTNDS